MVDVICNNYSLYSNRYFWNAAEQKGEYWERQEDSLWEGYCHQKSSLHQGALRRILLDVQSLLWQSSTVRCFGYSQHGPYSWFRQEIQNSIWCFGCSGKRSRGIVGQLRDLSDQSYWESRQSFQREGEEVDVRTGWSQPEVESGVGRPENYILEPEI